MNEAVWKLAEAVLASSPVAAAVLQRDVRFPSVVELGTELDRLRAMVANCKMGSAGTRDSEFAQSLNASRGPGRRP